MIKTSIPSLLQVIVNILKAVADMKIRTDIRNGV